VGYVELLELRTFCCVREDAEVVLPDFDIAEEDCLFCLSGPGIDVSL